MIYTTNWIERLNRDYKRVIINLTLKNEKLEKSAQLISSDEYTKISPTGEKIPELDLNREPQFNQFTGTYAYPEKYVFKPSFMQNLRYFFNYQLNHMYLRYFMWTRTLRRSPL